MGFGLRTGRVQIRAPPRVPEPNPRSERTGVSCFFFESDADVPPQILSLNALSRVLRAPQKVLGCLATLPVLKSYRQCDSLPLSLTTSRVRGQSHDPKNLLACSRERRSCKMCADRLASKPILVGDIASNVEHQRVSGTARHRELDAKLCTLRFGSMGPPQLTRIGHLV
jgi:hypothetical protein